jgi:hypothetical protein
MRKLVLSAILFCMAATTAWAETENFDQASPGFIPPGWTCGVTGRGSPVWKVESDPSAPSKPNALKQSGTGTFPWCVKKAVSIADGFVEVKFKPLSGREDQAGGVVWRWKDGNDYYIARANALENNLSLYHTENGRRLIIKSAATPVVTNQWHTLRVDFAGPAIKVSLDGKQFIALDDTHISGPGAVGVWTKADSVTEFDDFVFGSQ